MNYLDFFKQDRYEDAINELQKELELEPTDEKYSLLATCFFLTDKNLDALKALEQIKQPTISDYQLWACIHQKLKNWDQMTVILKTAHRICPSAEIYYRLAVAEGQESRVYSLDTATKEIMRRYLLKAIEFENCRAEAYLLLADLYEFKDFNNKVNTLNQAFQKHSDNSIIRLELASTLIYHKKEYEEVIPLLEPLLGTLKFEQRARWYVFECLVRQKKYDEAIFHLNLLPIKQDALYRIKADLFFRQGQLGQWLLISAEYANTKDLEYKIRYHFQKAYINFKKDNIRQAINDFKHGAELWLGLDVSLDIYIFVDLDFFDIPYLQFDLVTDICETLVLLKDETELITQEITGFLLYVIYKHLDCEPDKQEELLQFFPEVSGSLLLFSAKLLGFPPGLGFEVSLQLLEQDLPQSIQQYLNYAIHQGEIRRPVLKSFTKNLSKGKERFSDTDLQKLSLIETNTLEQYAKFKDPEVTNAVWVPFYNEFWRDLLFETESFNTVAEVTETIISATDSKNTQALFDHAYSMNRLGNESEALNSYLKVLKQQPNNASALNNTSLIYEKRKMLDEAFSLVSKAFNIDPSNKIFSSNYERLKSKIDFRDQSLQQLQGLIKKITTKAISVGLSEEDLIEVNMLYWNSDVMLKTIQARLDLHCQGSSNIYNFILPKTADEKCPNCLIDLVYKNRSTRDSEEKMCLGCGHNSKNRGWCNCAYCERIREQQRLEAEKLRHQESLKEFEKLKEQYFNYAYVEWAIKKLTRKDKIFLKAFIEVVQSSKEATWEEVCEQAGVVSQKLYLKKLQKLKLLIHHPDKGVVHNAAVQIDMLEVESVRKISPSIRFNVFQRDNHVCQYCGRTPPDIKLVIDHLIPVAKGGTDAFDNLVTSCEECNSGKSDKLIKDFTGGFGKEEWSNHIRAEHLDHLQKRRDKLDELKQYWAFLLKRRNLSERDSEAIHTFIETYEPEWIKLAINIAVSKGIKDYVKYTAGILKNWAKEGLPEHLSNSTLVLTPKTATPKQTAYLSYLLEKAALSLSDVSDKDNLDELTVAEARLLIAELIEQIEDQV